MILVIDKVKEIKINDDGSKNYELEEIIGREEEILSLSNGKNVLLPSGLKAFA